MAHRTPAVVVAALLVAGCSGTESGEPGERRSPAAATPATTLLPGIADSAELSEPVAVQGTVTRADGTAAPDALVQLATHPTDDDLATAGTGSYLLEPVATARTGPDGRYELRIAADLRAELPADEDGLVEFAVFVESPDGRGQAPYWTAPAALTHPHTLDVELRPPG